MAESKNQDRQLLLSDTALAEEHERLGAHLMLFFGGGELRDKIEELHLDYREILIPNSERRYLFLAKPNR